MTQEQAQGAVQSYVNELGQAQVQLQAQDGQSVSISFLSWEFPGKPGACFGSKCPLEKGKYCSAL